MIFASYRTVLRTFIFILLGSLAVTRITTAQVLHQAVPQLSVEQIADRLQQMNARRKAALKSYQNRRDMSVLYKGSFADGGATESVLMTFTAPSTKSFTVISSSGPQLLRDAVFQREMDSEQTASTEQSQQDSALSLENYNMHLDGQEKLPLGECYVISVSPRNTGEFTYIGRVWVQSTDFAVVRIEAKPALDPSPLISAGRFTTEFQKVGDFYLPHRTTSTSQIRFGGTATFTIEYGIYTLIRSDQVKPFQDSSTEPQSPVR